MFKTRVKRSMFKSRESLHIHIPYPALKIGRLAIQKNCQGKGFGTLIVNYIVGMALIHSKKIGCRYVAVDAYNHQIALNFYTKNGFMKLKKTKRETNIPMYLDLLKKT